MDEQQPAHTFRFGVESERRFQRLVARTGMSGVELVRRAMKSYEFGLDNYDAMLSQAPTVVFPARVEREDGDNV